MDPGSPALDDLGFLDIFGSQDKHSSMDLDAGLSGVGLHELGEGSLALNMEPSLRRFTGHELVSAALRSQPDSGSVPLTVSDKDIRPSVCTSAEHGAAPAMPAAPPAPAVATTPAPMPVLAQPPRQFTIKPMPARKTASCKPVVKVEAVEPQPSQLQQYTEPDTAAFESDSEEPSSAYGGKRRKRIRNAKQQELNRLAQQRYRERRKQKYSTLQGTVEELSGRLSQLSTLEAANTELQQRNTQLEVVVKEQNTQLQVQKDAITRQAQQLQTQALQLGNQAKQLQAQVSVIQQQDQTLLELRSKLEALEAAGGSSSSGDKPAPADAAGVAAVPDADHIALAVRAVLTGVSSMASVTFPVAKDAAQMQQMVVQLPDALLQQIRSCCREVALHLKKTEVKEQPHAISVPCC